VRTLQQTALIELESEAEAIALTNSGLLLVGLAEEGEIAVIELESKQEKGRVGF
jgi:hypothetical protein